MSTGETDTNHPLPPGYTDRPACMEDAASVTALINADDLAVLGLVTIDAEDTLRDWTIPGFNLETDTRMVIASDGQAAGYYEVWDLYDPHTTINIWGRTHPAHIGRGIGSYLLEWAERRASLAISKAPPEARVSLNCGILAIHQGGQELLKQSGYTLIRHGLRMVIELQSAPPLPVWPDGIQIRQIRDGELRAAFAAMREAFHDHWGYLETPFEEEFERFQHHVKSDPDYDPGLFFLAMDGEEIAGVNLSRRKVGDDPEMGWVASLSVRRPWRKKGIGVGLLQHSFREFYYRGYRKVGLGVDAQNLTGALRLYEKAGMHSDPQRQIDIYSKIVRDGKELSRQNISDG